MQRCSESERDTQTPSDRRSESAKRTATPRPSRRAVETPAGAGRGARPHAHRDRHWPAAPALRCFPLTKPTYNPLRGWWPRVRSPRCRSICPKGSVVICYRRVRGARPWGSQGTRSRDPRRSRPLWPKSRRTGARAGDAPLQASIARLQTPDLPWFLGGQGRSLGGCGWPRHPARSPSRSFRSWWGARPREGADTRRQTRQGPGRPAGDGRPRWAGEPFSRHCPQGAPGETLRGQADPRRRAQEEKVAGLALSRRSRTSPGVGSEGLQRMQLAARGGGTRGRGDEPREGAPELPAAGRLRGPLRPPPMPSPAPRRPQPRTRRPLRPVLAS